MALKKCKECGEQVSTSAKTCPKCGVKNPAKKQSVLTLLLVCMAAIVLVAMLAKNQDPPDTATAQAAITQHRAADTPDKPQYEWVYKSYKDDMTSKDALSGTLSSSNSLNLSFPYQGLNHGHLTVRKHPKYGTDLILEIDRGQLICAYDGCTVSIRFGEGSIQKFTAVSASDGSLNVLFFRNPGKLIERLARGEVLRVQAEMYQQGEQTLVFEPTAGLVWPPKPDGQGAK